MPDEKIDKIIELLTELAESIFESNKTGREVVVQNFPKQEIQQVEFVNTIGFPEIQDVFQTNLPVFPEFNFPDFPEVKIPETVKVSNLSEIKFPKFPKIPKEISLREINSITRGLQVIVDVINELKIETQQVSEKVGTHVSTAVMGSHKEKTPGDTRFDPDDDTPTYIGTNPNEGASTGSDNWEILKFTYSGSNTTRIQRKVGVWDNRTTLF